MSRTPLQDYREMRRRFDALAELAEAKALDDAVDRLRNLINPMGFTYSGFGTMFDGDDSSNDVRLEFSDRFFGAAFKTYKDRKLDHGDPVARSHLEGADFLVTSQVHASVPRRHRYDSRDEISELFSQFDIEDHVCMVVPSRFGRGVGYVALGRHASHRPDRLADVAMENRPYLRMAAALLMDKALRVSGRSGQPILTRAQSGVLQALAEGMSTRDIAERDRRSIHTIRSHVHAARVRLGAQTTTEAVARALSLSEIRLL